ncbi:MAG: 3-oxoacyl-ACP reductase [Hoeflea sp. BRH_c9]|nr:MAG: 3-oxoacyl-ACP reductase [Hoeflea sp. BRH_c9]
MTQTQQPRVALVTGAARGIGTAIAERLATDGMHVILADILDSGEQTASELRSKGLSCSFAWVDFGDLASVESFVQAQIRAHGRIDVAVNNAGISPKHQGKRLPIDETPLEEWQKVVDINLTACFLVAKAVLPGMKAGRWGRIVNMASQAGRTRSQVAGSHYSASKAGLIGFTRTLAGEVGPFGITANSIAPGRIDTPMAAEAGSEANERYLSAIPAGRLGTPDDIGAAVSYFASEEAGFVTGVCLDVNGGHFMA